MSSSIFALSTPPGISALGVVRLSGPDTFKAIRTLLGPNQPFISKMRKTHLRKIYSVKGSLLDEAIIILYGEEKSFTGENMAELQLHGSHVVIKTVLESLSKLAYLRPAEAGEFTKRALENNKLNLFQVEGLSDLLLADTELQQEKALNTYSGVISNRISDWKMAVIKMLSLVEASIDFYDELEVLNIASIIKRDLKALENELIDERNGFKAAEAIRDGFEVAFVGKTNVGKSTLLNRLAKRNVSITSEISGTTRDIIELRFNLSGLPVTFLDTAGLRSTDDSIEKVGVANSIIRANDSDIRVFLVDDIQEIQGLGVKRKTCDIILRPKGDISGSEPSVSGKTGKGLSFLLEALSEILQKKVTKASSITRLRHLEKVNISLENIELIKTQLENDNPEIEIIAEGFRSILRSFDGLLGLVDTEEVLGEIFSSFCIGK